MGLNCFTDVLHDQASSPSGTWQEYFHHVILDLGYFMFSSDDEENAKDTLRREYLWLNESKAAKEQLDRELARSKQKWQAMRNRNPRGTRKLDIQGWEELLYRISQGREESLFA